MNEPHYLGAFAHEAATYLGFGAFVIAISSMACAITWFRSSNRHLRPAVALALVGGVCSAITLLIAALAMDLQLHDLNWVTTAYAEAIGVLWMPVLAITTLLIAWLIVPTRLRPAPCYTRRNT